MNSRVWRLFIQKEGGEREFKLEDELGAADVERRGQQSQEALLVLVCLIIC